jgi:hypothetical protein
VALWAVLKKVSLGYVALALVYCCLALLVCGFTGGVKGKSRVCGSSTCVLMPCGYVALRALLKKVSLGYMAPALVYCCLAGMWLYRRCYR